MPLKIEQQPSLIGINHIPSKMRVKLNLIDNFKMESEFACIFIESSFPRVQIDQQKIREGIGYYKPLSFMKQKKQENIARGTRKIASIAREKNILLAIANRGKPNKEAIRQKVLVEEPQPKKINFASRKPEVHFDLGWVHIESTKPYLEVISKPNFPDIDYKPGDVNIYLLQKGYVKVRYVGENIDLLG